MASIFDLVTAKELAVYWTEKNKNNQPLLGETLFPKERQVGTEIEWIKGANNQPVALKLSSYDAKAIRRDNQGVEKYKTEMPFFKESVYVDEKLRQQLNNMISSNNQKVVDAILNKIYSNNAKLIDASTISMERMRMELLTTGMIKLSSNGQSFDYDYGVAEDQKKTVKMSWSNPKADIIGDIQSYKDEMKAKGVDITRGVCNSSVTKYFTTNEAMKNAIYVFAQGTVPLTVQAAINYIFQQTGVKLYEYNNVYVDEAGAAHKYIPDDTLTLLPDGKLGNTYMGTTPEESDLMNGVNNAQVELVNGGVAVTTSKMTDPVNVDTKVTMVSLPSFEEADKIVIVDTKVE